MRRSPISYRSAGACPPRSTDLGEKRPQPRNHEWLLSRPTRGEGQALALREGEVLFVPVARGPVPRDLNRLKQDLQESHDLQDYLPRNEQFFLQWLPLQVF